MTIIKSVGSLSKDDFHADATGLSQRSSGDWRRVGYSRLMGFEEAGTLARLKAHRREFIDPKIVENGVRVIKTTRD
jgi:hypothetical protein